MDERERLGLLTKPTGFDITKPNPQLPGFTPHPELHWSDNLLLKEYKIEQWDVKPASTKLAPEIYQNKSFGKIYMDPVQKVGNKEIWWSKDTAKHSGASQGLEPSTYNRISQLQ